jgi:hypothetical protein
LVEIREEIMGVFNWKKKRIPKQSCINCHFLMKYNREVTQQNRDAVKKSNDYSWLGGGKEQFLEPGCFHKVWVMPYDGKFDLKKVFLEIDRSDSCYFREYVPHMSFAASSDLLNKENEKQNKSYDRRLVIISLIIAGLSFIASLVSLYYSLWHR